MPLLNTFPGFTGRGSCFTAERESYLLFLLSGPSQSRHTILTILSLRDADQTFSGSDSVTSQTVDRETVSGSKKSIWRLSHLRITQQASSALNRLTLELRRCVELDQEKMTIQHNDIHDITATLLTDVFHNVATECPLQPLTSETSQHARPTPTTMPD